MYGKVLFFILLLTGPLPAQYSSNHRHSAEPPSHNLQHLKSWAGEYPISEKGNIFNDPEVRKTLLALLGDADYKSLPENFAQAEVIDIIHGYLVLLSKKSDSTPQAVALLRLSDGKAHVVLYSIGGLVLYSRTSVPAGEPDLAVCLSDPGAKEPPAGLSPQDFERLKSWANEYPISTRGNIFRDPELHQALLDLLGDANYKRLIEDFAKARRIDVIRGYLLLRSMTDQSNPRHETAMVAFRLSDRTAYVAFHSPGKSTLYPAGEPVDLPKCISERMTTGTGW